MLISLVTVGAWTKTLLAAAKEVGRTAPALPWQIQRAGFDLSRASNPAMSKGINWPADGGLTGSGILHLTQDCKRASF